MTPSMRELKSIRYLYAKLRNDDDEKTRKQIAGLIDWVESIEDPMIHDIVEYRFVRGFTWVKTAHRVGGGNTEDGVRMLVKRFLNKQ